MAECVIIYGRSGSGKSFSFRNFGRSDVLLIGVEKKRLPFKTPFKYTIYSSDVHLIIEKLNGMASAGIKTAIIDDVGYLMTQMFMNKHGQGDQFKMYNEIANDMWLLIKAIKALPIDTIVYLVMHQDTNDNGETKLRTIGKLLDSKVCIEGMVTTCLRCIVHNGNHIFLTQSTGSDISKSPEGMFDSIQIQNDLKYVDDKIREYYEM